MRENLRRGLSFFLATASLLVFGCATEAPKQPVDKAEAIVEQFLDSWAKGESADKLSGGDRPIQATDPDRNAGYRLLSYLGKDAKQTQEAPPRFRCQVALTLQDRKGKKQDKEVTYDVQIGDAIVISRATR